MLRDACPWFAWYPVCLKSGGMAWCRTVMRIPVMVHGRVDGCCVDVYEYEHERITDEN